MGAKMIVFDGNVWRTIGLLFLFAIAGNMPATIISLLLGFGLGAVEFGISLIFLGIVGRIAALIFATKFHSLKQEQLLYGCSIYILGPSVLSLFFGLQVAIEEFFQTAILSWGLWQGMKPTYQRASSEHKPA